MSGYSGGTTEIDLNRFRRMIAESGTATYTDSVLMDTISAYPLPDVTGEWPLLLSGSVNTSWVATYDFAAAAADVWAEKATNVATYFDFTADGATFNKSQVYAQCSKEERKWRARRSIGTHTMTPYPSQRTADEWILNLAEDDD